MTVAEAYRDLAEAYDGRDHQSDRFVRVRDESLWLVLDAWPRMVRLLESLEGAGEEIQMVVRYVSK